MSDQEMILFEGKYIRLLKRGGWEYVERRHISGIVAMIAVTSDDKIVLCEQYRVPVQKPVLELPAGLVNDSPENAEESFEEAARRELIEETGYRSEKMDFLFEGPPAPGSSSAMMAFYRAEGLEKISAGGGDETENITVHEIALNEIEERLSGFREKGVLIDPKIFVGLQFVRKKAL